MSDDMRIPADPGTVVRNFTEAANLLCLGLSQPEEPVNGLVRRLREIDAVTWFTSAATGCLADPGTSPREVFLEPGASLETLVYVKRRCAGMAQERAGTETWLRAMAGYFLCIAAALVHHQTLITTRDSEEAATTLRRLAAASPAPWAALFAAAAQEAAQLDESANGSS